MTQDEYNEAAALVVRLRKDLELHTDALVKSNAQCGEYLRQNEQLHSELVGVRAALAATTEQRDSLQRTLDEWERADTKPHERVTADDVADHVVPPVLPMCMTCHGCGSVLEPDSRPGALYCMNFKCERTNTADTDSPYNGPCTSAVRHE